ncbi:mRNA surveillance protein pelota [Candidatus Woesearchaeota archaeon]|nr:MAG: mRNA surveillance protein pelota [Candidatus Woesearchaeota archaeon]
MKIIHKNFKTGELKFQVQNPDDLWHVSQIIDPGDLVSGQTFRKIKIGNEDQRKAATVKKKVFLTIMVERVEFHKYSDTLRVLGTIVEGPEDLQKGSHHTISIEQNSIIKLKKEKWLSFQIEKVAEASKQNLPKIILCVMDREQAIFALSKQFDYQIISSIEGDVERKEKRASFKGGFYTEIVKILNDYSKRYKPKNIILASPAFFKDDLYKSIKDKDLKDLIVLATCSSVSKNGLNELLKRPEVRQVLHQDRVAKEIKFVEELLSEISKDGAASYGFNETRDAAIAGAVKTLLVTDSFIKKKRESDDYSSLDSVMKAVDASKGEIHIISSDNDAGKKLDGLGGIGAVLRYKTNFS